MADPVITVDEVIEHNYIETDCSYRDLIQRTIPFAQSKVNTDLNNAYVVATHAKEAEYRAAVCVYTWYLVLPKINLFSLEGIGNLKQDTVDKVYMNKTDTKQVRNMLLEEFNGFMSTIKAAMDAAGTDLDQPEGSATIGNLQFISIGGSENYKTFYGKGLENNDDNLRE
jgi:hypothetical protein